MRIEFGKQKNMWFNYVCNLILLVWEAYAFLLEYQALCRLGKYYNYCIVMYLWNIYIMCWSYWIVHHMFHMTLPQVAMQLYHKILCDGDVNIPISMGLVLPYSKRCKCSPCVTHFLETKAYTDLTQPLYLAFYMHTSAYSVCVCT